MCTTSLPYLRSKAVGSCGNWVPSFRPSQSRHCFPIKATTRTCLHAIMASRHVTMFNIHAFSIARWRERCLARLRLGVVVREALERREAMVELASSRTNPSTQSNLGSLLSKHRFEPTTDRWAFPMGGLRVYVDFDPDPFPDRKGRFRFERDDILVDVVGISAVRSRRTRTSTRHG